jgi:branched-chain amino acid aminotransferase
MSVRLAAPHQLNPKPDPDDLVFGKHFTDHMLKVSYHRRLGGWQKPEIMPLENLVLHPAAKVFHYAVEVISLFQSNSFFALPYIFQLRISLSYGVN